MKYFLVLLVVISSHALANNSSVEKAMEVSEFLGGADIKKIIVQTIKQRSAMLLEKRMKITPEEQPLLDEYLTELEAKLTQMLDEPSFNQQLGRIYLDYYSEAELDQIIAFYQSPLGQKMRAQSPALTKDVKKAISKKTEELVPQLRGMALHLKSKLDGWRSIK